MDRELIHPFIEAAGTVLTSVRGSLLLLSQGGEGADTGSAAKLLNNVIRDAAALGLDSVSAKAAECRKHLTSDSVNRSLDRVAALEAELLNLELENGFAADASGLVDGGFELLSGESEVDAATAFAIDAETLEVFRSEGEELLANISLGLDVIEASPSDQNALWDIRRAAHTFKGAAGIVGLTEAASVAHRMEDLLDRLVETNSAASVQMVEFFRGCVRSLGSVLDGAPANAAGLELAYSSAAASLGSLKMPAEPPQASSAAPKAIDHMPTVRVSLERLSEMVRLAEQMRGSVGLSAPQRELSAEIHEGLLRLRMVRFGNLETRLARAVSVTASEENKRAVLEIETPDVEIDTLIVDALIEPLLHLIKNAVVHGIEEPDVRRMVGKHEFGLVSVRVDADSEGVVLTISDDGAGIGVEKLKQRAVERGSIPADSAATLSDREAFKLLFERGLTTADRVDLNAGRGIGMGIVKEAIESRGGSIHIESTPQLGTTFTLMLPVARESKETAGGSKARVPSNGGVSPHESPYSLLHTPVSAAPLVLVVDDSPTVRHHNQRIVEQAGCRVITAEHGADALEILLGGTVEPDLILSDVEMPHMDGWQLLQYIKADDHLGHVPVVMVTSLDADNYKAMARNLGAADYVVKPFGTKDIERVLSLVNVPA